jgi:radical SAM/Cys-rich protein
VHSESSIQNTPKDPIGVESFSLCLSRMGLRLTRGEATTLQINMGLLCNQECRHCHLAAGPRRQEVMDRRTTDEVVGFTRKGSFRTIDITGGAPELNPNLVPLIERLSPIVPHVLLRSNLTSLANGKRGALIQTCIRNRVVILASFPSLDMTEAESQRGSGTFQKSIRVLKNLNSLGYGQKGSNLELNLVCNPTGAFLPPAQSDAEKTFRSMLGNKWGILFNHLYTFANVPLGRFRRWLQDSGNLEKYMQMISSRFNTCAIEGLMCRTLVSVSWDGYLYDCDFNLARGLPMAGRRTHVSEMAGPPEPGASIAVSDHCYTCTAGAGFT